MSGKPTEKGRRLSFRKLYPDLWVWARFMRACVPFARTLISRNDEKQAEAYRMFMRSLIATAEVIQKENLRLRLKEPPFILTSSWLENHIASGRGMRAPSPLDVLDRDDVERMRFLRELHARRFEPRERIPRRAEPVQAVKKGFLARFRERTEQARFAAEHVNLAEESLHLGQGDFALSLEEARAHYETALSALEGIDLPELRAAISANLGNLFLVYPTERREPCAREAVRALLQAKESLAPYAPVLDSWKEILREKPGWARWKALPKALRMMLPMFFKALLRGVPAPVLLTCAFENEFMGNVEWSLGVAHMQLGEHGKDVERFESALGFFPGSEHGEERAGLLVTRGLAHLEDTEGSRVDNLFLARESFTGALNECGEELAPQAYVLGLVYHARTWLEPELMALMKPEDRDGDLAWLTDRLRTAARVGRAEGMHAAAQEALLLLGEVYVLRNDTPRAYRALVIAARVAERLARRARTVRWKSYLTGTRAPLYERLVRTSLDYAGESQRERVYHSALVFAERARTRFLQEQLASRDLLPEGANPGDIEEFVKLRRAWLGTELALLQQELAPPSGGSEELAGMLRDRRNVVEARYLTERDRVRQQFGDPAYDPDEPILPVRVPEIRSVVDALSAERTTALVEYFITDRSLVAFALFPPTNGCREGPAVLDTRISRDELHDIDARWSRGFTWLRGAGPPLHPRQWESGYLHQVLQRLANVARLPAELLHAWELKNRRRIARIILVPHRFLHVVPLHALILEGGALWGERALIQYLPSASILWRLLSRRRPDAAGRRTGLAPPPGDGHAALAIAYSPSPERSAASPPIVFSAHEARAVATHTGGAVLEGSAATPSRVIEEMQDAAYVHFACHGAFDAENPMESGLDLAPEAGAAGTPGKLPGNGNSDRHAHEARSFSRLTLGRIFERVRLDRTDLVVLSACETGIPDPKLEELRGEYMGLPTGFLYAGASTVISTLWPVDDIATWLLMRAFAREITAGAGPAEALRSARQELRGLSSDCVLQQVARAAQSEPDSFRRERMRERGQGFCAMGEFPFASPYWWAGFTVNGLG